MKASDLFVRCLEAEGVEYIFAVPGEENLDLLESLRESSIRLVVTRHEQAAGFMAATWGRLTGSRESASPPWAPEPPTWSPPRPSPSSAPCPW
jgi:TPP-dependent 2-oxoacid decarboxylase